MFGISFNSVNFIKLYFMKIYDIFFISKQDIKKKCTHKYYNHHNIYKNLYCDILIQNNNNIIKYKKIHKNNFKNCLKDIIDENNIIYWIYKNNIKQLLKYKLVVLDFQTIYDYKNKKELNIIYLKKLSKYLLDNKIIFSIISEINPKSFPKIKYFNPNNLVTPYHYKVKSVVGVIKLGINKYNNKSVPVSLNKIINDIMNQYGYNEREIIYLNSKKIENINTIII